MKRNIISNISIGAKILTESLEGLCHHTLSRVIFVFQVFFHCGNAFCSNYHVGRDLVNFMAVGLFFSKPRTEVQKPLEQYYYRQGGFTPKLNLEITVATVYVETVR